MTAGNRGRRIISALQQLEQFVPALPRSDSAVHVLTGACVEAVDAGKEDDSGLLLVRFPGGAPFQVIGERYLDLQIIESVRFEQDGGEGGSAVSDRVADLTRHLHGKHDL